MKEKLSNNKGEIFVGIKKEYIKLARLTLNGERIESKDLRIKLEGTKRIILVDNFKLTEVLENMFNGLVSPRTIDFTAFTNDVDVVEGYGTIKESIAYPHPSNPDGTMRYFTLDIEKVRFSSVPQIKADKTPKSEPKPEPKKEEFMELTLNTDYENKVSIRKEHVDYYLESKSDGTNIYLMGRERHVWVKEDFKTVAGLMKK